MYVHNNSVTETQDCDFFNFFTNPKHRCCHIVALVCLCVYVCVRVCDPLNVVVTCLTTVHLEVTPVIFRASLYQLSAHDF